MNKEQLIPILDTLYKKLDIPHLPTCSLHPLPHDNYRLFWSVLNGHKQVAIDIDPTTGDVLRVSKATPSSETIEARAHQARILAIARSTLLWLYHNESFLEKGD